MRLVKDKQRAYALNSKRNINGENVDSPAYAMAIAA
jgi:hypothetical protein